jgi:hypothetical protein
MYNFQRPSIAASATASASRARFGGTCAHCQFSASGLMSSNAPPFGMLSARRMDARPSYRAISVTPSQFSSASNSEVAATTRDDSSDAVPSIEMARVPCGSSPLATV